MIWVSGVNHLHVRLSTKKTASARRLFGQKYDYYHSNPCSWCKQSRQTVFPLKCMTCDALPQKMQEGEYFWSTIPSPSTNISSGVPTSISIVLRNSFGRTIRPSSSTFRVIPVAFIFSSPSYRVYGYHNINPPVSNIPLMTFLKTFYDSVISPGRLI